MQVWLLQLQGRRAPSPFGRLFICSRAETWVLSGASESDGWTSRERGMRRGRPPRLDRQSQQALCSLCECGGSWKISTAGPGTSACQQSWCRSRCASSGFGLDDAYSRYPAEQLQVLQVVHGESIFGQGFCLRALPPGSRAEWALEKPGRVPEE